jgi:Holliday junction DNA helicase RuvA
VIARLRGKRAGLTAAGLVLDVNGVGYLVHATPSVLARNGAEITVETYLHVREDALQLYGFATAEERDLFVHLLSVSGVGPKVALAIVSGSTPSDLRRAIALEDTARFEAIPGIGKKTGAPTDAGGPVADLVARDALVELGWSLVDAERALAGVDPALPVEEQVRAALRKAA